MDMKWLCSSAMCAWVVASTLPVAAHAGIAVDDVAAQQLVEAIRHTDRASIKSLVASGVSVNAQDSSGFTALMHTVKMGDAAMTSELIQAGAALDVTNSEGQTALHLASGSGQTDIVTLLVESGADITIKDKNGMTALDYAIEQNLVDVAMAIDPSAITVTTTEAGLEVVTALASAGGGGISTTTIAAGAGAAGLGAAAAAGGGGGGGGDTASGDSTPAPDSTPTPRPRPNPSPNPTPNPTPPDNPGGNGDDDEDEPVNEAERLPQDLTYYQDRYAFKHTNALNLTGATGAGIKVAIIDTGLFFDHPDIIADRALSRDFYGNNLDAEPDIQSGTSSHGTSVAGIIAAQHNDIGIDGLAPDATLIALKAASDYGQLPNTDIIEALNYAADQHAQIVNNSWGSSTLITDPGANVPQAELDAYARIIENGGIVVFAAGNSAQNQVSVHAGLPHLRPEFKGHWLAAVSIGNDGKFSHSFAFGGGSNQCGIAKEWCLAAPGDLVMVPIAPDLQGTLRTPDGDYLFPQGYFITSGTSFSAPHVSGALALLLDKFPVFEADPTLAVERLLESADRDFVGYDDNLYGQGILDVKEALQPAGVLSVAQDKHINGANDSLLSETAISLGLASGDALSQQGLTVGVLDKYKRLYHMSVTDASGQVMPMTQRFYRFNQNLLDEVMAINDMITVGFSTSSQFEEGQQSPKNIATSERVIRGSFEDEYEQARMGFSYQAESLSVDVRYNVPTDQAFGFGVIDSYDSTQSAGSSAALNPYLGFAAEGVNVVNGFDLSRSTQIRLGSFFGSTGNEINNEPEQVSGFVGEVNHQINNRFALGLQMGYLNETHTFLGSHTSGAFATDEGTPTWFSSAAAQYQVADDTNLFLTYSAGLSTPQAQTDSLFTGFSSIVSEGFSLGVTHDNWLQPDDKVGVTLSQPLRIVDGQASVNTAVASDVAGNVYYNNTQFNLNPSGRELDAEVFYQAELDEDITLGTSAMYRHQPNHTLDADPEGVVMVKLSYGF